jgi:hypothetical protein
VIYIIVALAFLFLVTPGLIRRFKELGSKHSAKFKNSELISVLLELDERYFAELIELYKREFGPGAARYARSTFRKWKSGEVRPNRNTFQRFYSSLPKAMSFDLKCEVVRRLRESYCHKDSFELEVYTDDWKKNLEPFVASMLQKSRTIELPRQLKDRISWLAEDEALLAEKIVAESEARESESMMSLLGEELRNIQLLLDKMNGRGKVTHTLDFPIGNINLIIKTRK